MTEPAPDKLEEMKWTADTGIADLRNLTDEEGRVHASFLKDELPLPGRNVRFTVTTSF